jgi:hypothetical protein
LLREQWQWDEMDPLREGGEGGRRHEERRVDRAMGIGEKEEGVEGCGKINGCHAIDSLRRLREIFLEVQVGFRVHRCSSFDLQIDTLGEVGIELPGER